MSMTTRTKAAISGAVAGLALLGVTAIPAFAQNQKQSATPAASRTTVAQLQATPTKEMKEMMERCNSMMSMMGGGNMPGMMNRTPRQ